jgi:hypothetical protein
MLNQDALRLALAASREPNKLRAAVELVQDGVVTASDAFLVLADGAKRRRQAEALAVLYHWAAPARQRPALVAAGQRVGLDLQPFVSLRSNSDARWAIQRSKLPEDLLVFWFMTHPREAVKEYPREELGAIAHLIWWNS